MAAGPGLRNWSPALATPRVAVATAFTRQAVSIPKTRQASLRCATRMEKVQPGVKELGRAIAATLNGGYCWPRLSSQIRAQNRIPGDNGRKFGNLFPNTPSSSTLIRKFATLADALGISRDLFHFGSRAHCGSSLRTNAYCRRRAPAAPGQSGSRLPNSPWRLQVEWGRPRLLCCALQSGAVLAE